MLTDRMYVEVFLNTENAKTEETEYSRQHPVYGED